MPNANGYVTTKVVANMLNVDPKTIGRWAREGKLPHTRTLGGHRRYDPVEIQELVDRLRVEATEEREGAAS